MALRYFLPSLSLRGHVSFLYRFDTGCANFAGTLPAMLGQVQLRLSGTLNYCHTGHAAAAGFASASATLITGPTHGVTRLEAPDRLVTVGAGLLPLGWARLVRAPAAVLADTSLDARAVWGPAIEQALHCAIEAPDAAQQVAALDRFLSDLVDRAPPIDDRIAAIDTWLAATPFSDVDGLARSLDLSSRHVRRLTSATHGAAPKRLASKYRTLRAATLLGLGEAPDWRSVADGFADQAHLIRDFQRFVGQSPRRLASSAPLGFANLVSARRPQGAALLQLWS